MTGAVAATGEALLGFAGALGLDAGLLEQYGAAFLRGAATTVALVAISVTAGLALALVIAYARIEGGRPMRLATTGFVGFFRGTPVLCQLFLIYYGTGQFHAGLQSVGLWPLFTDAFWCSALTFTLNTAAYQSVIIAGAVRALPAGQAEAGRALGMTTPAIWRQILLPQALVIGLRPLGNEVVLMIKASSVASVVTVVDVMGATRWAFQGSLDFEVYLWAAALYLAMVEAVRRIWILLERRATRHLRGA